MLLVIVGAGASYDSYADMPPPSNEIDVLVAGGDFENKRPPLARDLFDSRPRFMRLFEQIPTISALVPRLRRAANVETELASIESDSDLDPTVSSEILGVRFYLQLAIWSVQQDWLEETAGVTNYGPLVRELRLWQARSGEAIRFVSFNYDTLLEDALQRTIPWIEPFSTFDAYVGSDDVKVYKPHGSVNWYRLVSSTPELRRVSDPPRGPSGYESEARSLGRYEQIQTLVSDAPNLTTLSPTPLDNQFRIYEPGNYFYAPQDDQPYWALPAISIPLEQKTDFMMPESHLESMRRDLREVDRVVVIGWRATERHFLGEWAKAKDGQVSALAVDPTPDGTIANLEDERCIDDANPLREGFSQFIQDSSHFREFLSMDR